MMLRTKGRLQEELTTDMGSFFMDMEVPLGSASTGDTADRSEEGVGYEASSLQSLQEALEKRLD